jgi:hypothetical protein
VLAVDPRQVDKELVPVRNAVVREPPGRRGVDENFASELVCHAVLPGTRCLVEIARRRSMAGVNRENGAAILGTERQ